MSISHANTEEQEIRFLIRPRVRHWMLHAAALSKNLPTTSVNNEIYLAEKRVITLCDNRSSSKEQRLLCTHIWAN
jgi:hypothetical protein